MPILGTCPSLLPTAGVPSRPLRPPARHVSHSPASRAAYRSRNRLSAPDLVATRPPAATPFPACTAEERRILLLQVLERSVFFVWVTPPDPPPILETADATCERLGGSTPRPRLAPGLAPRSARPASFTRALRGRQAAPSAASGSAAGYPAGPPPRITGLQRRFRGPSRPRLANRGTAGVSPRGPFSTSGANSN